MPRSASPAATALMNGCAIPAPAPCARTKQAEGSGGARRRAETRVVSLTLIAREVMSNSSRSPKADSPALTQLSTRERFESRSHLLDEEAHDGVQGSIF